MILLDSVILNIQEQILKLGRGKIFTKIELGLDPDFSLGSDPFLLFDFDISHHNLIKVGNNLTIDFCEAQNRIVAILDSEVNFKKELAWLNTRPSLTGAQFLRAQALRNELKHLLPQ
jgi:hypothetical protein